MLWGTQRESPPSYRLPAGWARTEVPGRGQHAFCADCRAPVDAHSVALMNYEVSRNLAGAPHWRLARERSAEWDAAHPRPVLTLPALLTGDGEA